MDTLTQLAIQDLYQFTFIYFRQSKILEITYTNEFETKSIRVKFKLTAPFKRYDNMKVRYAYFELNAINDDIIKTAIKMYRADSGNRVYVSRCIYALFYKKNVKHLEIHHKNLDSLDNTINNLECLTKAEHIELHENLTPRKKRYRTPTISATKVNKVLKMLQQGKTYKYITKALKISSKTLAKIKKACNTDVNCIQVTLRKVSQNCRKIKERITQITSNIKTAEKNLVKQFKDRFYLYIIPLCKHVHIYTPLTPPKHSAIHTDSS